MESLIFSIDEGIADDTVAAIQQEMSVAGFDVQIERREGGPQASVWLYVPTLVAILLVKPFFESIAKKAGEDSYPHLKKALGKIVKELCKIKFSIVGKQPGELEKQFSLVVSFYFRVDDNCRVKFLIRNGLSDAQYCQCTDRMCDLLIQYVTSERSNLRVLLDDASPKRLVLLDFDLDANNWRVFSVNPPRSA